MSRRFFREFNGGVTDGNGIGADIGFGMRAFADGHRLFKQLIENGADRLFCLRRFKARADLAEYLRFSDDHGIQAARHTE